MMTPQPACDLCGATPVSLHAKCHGNAPLHATIEGGDLVLRCYIPSCFREVARYNIGQIDRLQSQLTQARERLAKIVVVEGEDAGVVRLSSDGPTHLETRTIDGIERKVGVYDHEYFSPLGDALMELYKWLEA